MSSNGTSTWVSVTPGLASENFLSVSSWRLSLMGVSSSNQTCSVRAWVLVAAWAAGAAAAGLVGSGFPLGGTAGLGASAGLVGAVAGAAAAGLVGSAGLG